ncbi:MAG: right-handed parallel beta-helix repeat-containing protein [Planctomycetes bacterium]|nr:right-handed parallel beta-helix repeat-containing protein [Planctomycetota bacterium]
MKPTILLGALLVLLTSLFAPAAVHLVPDQYLTIQQAIDDCNAGDTVVIAPGTYTGPGNRDIDFLGKAITVRSTDPNNPNIVAATIIDCNGAGRGFRFDGGEEPDSVLAGLTITNGYGPDDAYIDYITWSAGGAIFCEDSSPTIINCRITASSAQKGGGICCSSSSPAIIGCTISTNWAWSGGGICCYNSMPTLTNCLLVGNSTENGGGGGMYNYKSYPNLTNCIFIGNDGGWGGGAICNLSGSFTINNCTITGNSADSGGGINCAGSAIANPKIDNSILWGNAADTGPQITFNSSSPFHLMVSYSNVEDGRGRVHAEPSNAVDWGPGNIDTDPRFVDDDNYHLSLYSLCINAGDPCNNATSAETDIDGEPRVINDRVDIGADEVDYEGPFLGVSPTKFAFDANEGGSNPERQILFIRNAGTGTVDWEMSNDCTWLKTQPDSGSSAGQADEVTFDVNIAGLTLGKYNCIVTVLAPSVVDSPQSVAVGLHIRRPVVYVPCDFPSIQAAIDDLLEGGTVIVADGIYSGEGNHDIDFKGKAITVRSENGPENCIIDCSDPERRYAHRGFGFHSGEDSNSVLSGFTITNGHAASCPRSRGGGAILCSSSSPTIADCIVVKNKAIGYCRALGSAGGGIFLDQCSPAIANCIIVGNVSNEGGEGGGIFCRQSSPIITNCTICDNSGDGIMSYDGSNPVIVNCIFWGNTYDQIRTESEGSYYGPSSAVVAFSNVQGGWPGLGNISEDALFFDHGYWDPNGTTHTTYDDFWVNGDYHLKSNGWRWDAQRKDWTWDEITSRCIDAGNPGWPLGDEPLSIYADPNNEWGRNLRINMGAYGGTAEASMPPYGWAIRSDYNNDGIANFTDFACWSIYHGYILPEPPDDSSPSPTLNSADLALLADRWLDQTTWFTTPSPASSLPPNAASNPDPPDGSVGIRLAPVLSWQGGFDAVSHDIYFGTANPPPFQTNQPGRTFEPGPLSPLTVYYWRIDEVKPYGTTVGPVWTFTTSSAGGR